MQDDMERIWGDRPTRVFISHTVDYKKMARDLKDRLNILGVAAFVAHDDIEPMREWEEEIRRALRSMDLLVALVSPTFHESRWTDQEVGAAIGRQITVVPVNMGTAPDGFLRSVQALSVAPQSIKEQNAAQIADDVFKFMLNDANMESKAVDSYIYAIGYSHSFKQTRELVKWLGFINRLSAEQERHFIEAFNGNNQVYDEYEMPRKVVPFLDKVTGNIYVLIEEYGRASLIHL